MSKVPLRVFCVSKEALRVSKMAVGVISQTSSLGESGNLRWICVSGRTEWACLGIGVPLMHFRSHKDGEHDGGDLLILKDKRSVCASVWNPGGY